MEFVVKPTRDDPGRFVLYPAFPSVWFVAL